MADELKIIITPILTKDIKNDGGEQLYKDYGFSYVSINNVGGVMFSGDYLINDNIPNDNPGDNVYYTAPAVRNTNSWKPEEGFGFV